MVVKRGDFDNRSSMTLLLSSLVPVYCKAGPKRDVIVPAGWLTGVV